MQWRSAVSHRPGVIGVTGLGAIEQDYSHAVFGNFPLMFALIAFVTFLLLARAFRSLLLAGKAVILNVLSLTATFGLMTWFWQEGHGSQAVFGIPGTGAITFWVPLMIFAFLFGLSMDYEVFILTRVREEYDRTGRHERRRHRRSRTNRTARHERGADPVPCVRVARFGARHRHQGARDGPGRGHPPGRHHREGASRAGARVTVRKMELVVPATVVTDDGGPDAATYRAGARARVAPVVLAEAAAPAV